jgi:Pro-kumamolisin, activation domain
MPSTKTNPAVNSMSLSKRNLSSQGSTSLEEIYSKPFRFHYLVLTLLLVSSILGTAHLAYSATGQVIPNNTPPFVKTATVVGPATPSETIEATVWLNIHNRQQLDSVAQDLYDPTSPRYRAWLSFPQIEADYAPTAQEANTVKQFLSAHNLSITLAPSCWPTSSLPIRRLCPAIKRDRAVQRHLFTTHHMSL